MYETFYWLLEATTGRKDRTQVLFQNVLRQFDLPIYEAAIKAGAKVL
jgi:hypothetical protein